MNKEILKDAIESGINAEAVNSTLEDIDSKSNKKGQNPKQVKMVVETIADMKKNINSIPDKKYASDLVRVNHEKIKAALNEGISPNEIAAILIESTEKANSRRTKSRLRFITKLIIKMKQKELKLIMDKENINENDMVNVKGYQKLLK